MSRPRGATSVLKKLGDREVEEIETERGWMLRFDDFVAVWVDGKFGFAYRGETSLTSRELSREVSSLG